MDVVLQYEVDREAVGGRWFCRVSTFANDVDFLLLGPYFILSYDTTVK